VKTPLGFGVDNEDGSNSVHLGSVVALSTTAQHHRHDVGCTVFPALSVRRQSIVEHDIGYQVAVYEDEIAIDE
jgi:hypothetical protein